ncbi:MAG: rod shape-determining protein MreD [Paludibacteraceae bacterium]|nr:rod shape-determining protein MreD [Paludibacteraceae bacterium]
MEWIKEIGRLLLLVALQVLLFDHLHIAIWGFPMVYILFLLNLSPRLSKWAELLIGCSVGLLMDVWYSSLGIHMAACVAIAFIRPMLLDNMLQDIERIKDRVMGRTIGTAEYAKCVVLLTVIHHFIVFALEAWSWSQWWIVLLQTLISSTMTIIILLGYDRLKQ